jgi:hypothetical protein
MDVGLGNEAVVPMSNFTWRPEPQETLELRGRAPELEMGLGAKRIQEEGATQGQEARPPTRPISPISCFDFPSPLVFGAKICAGSSLEIPEIPETEVVSLWAATE